MADKFGRKYLLEIQIDEAGKTMPIELPFTVEFDIERTTLGSSNVAKFRIYNLSKTSRDLLRFNVSNYGGPFRALSFRAGYGENIPLVFSGNVHQAFSHRQGVDFITEIECYDGGFAIVNGVANLPPPILGTPFQSIIVTLMTQLPHTQFGGIGNYPGVLTKGNAYTGNLVQNLQTLTGNGFFIDRGKSYALNTEEYLATADSLQVINAASGLIGSPMLEQTKVTFDMIFEPTLQVGSKIFLESLTENNFDGEYKVTAVKHRGMISGAVSGTCTTIGEFFFSKINLPVTVITVPGL